MNLRATTPRPNLFERLRAAVSGNPLFPAQKMSERMPDLERWSMPHRAVDMKDWEVAINMAKNIYNPDRSRLMDLYDSILVDSHLASVKESRVLRVVRSKFKLIGKDGKPRTDLMAMLESQWFEDFLTYVADAKFHGHTLIELAELVKPGQLKSVNRIDPRNVLPWHGVVSKRQGDTDGYKFREKPWKDYFIEVGRADDLGLLWQVAPVAVIKKFGMGAWSAYVDKFGIPSSWVKTNSTSKERVRQLEEVMQNLLSSAYAVIGGEEEIQIMPTPGTDAHKVFDELISRTNSEMSKRILGQDGTSDNKDASGTYGSLKVLQGVAEDRHQADKSSVRYLVNDELFPRLINLGYPFQGVRFEWDELRDMTPTEMVDAVSKLGAVFEIDHNHVAERTGIKIIGIRRMPGEVSDNQPGGAGRQGGKKKGEQKPGTGDPEEEEDGATASWPQAHVQRCGVCGGHREVMALGPVLDQKAIDALMSAAEAGQDWSNPYFTEVGMQYRDALLNTWGRDIEQLDYTARDHAASAAMEINLFRFSAAKTTAALVDLNILLKESNGLADFKKRVAEGDVLSNYNKRWLETEYQHAVNVGIQSSRYHDQIRNTEAFPFWEYITQGDAQVRPVHAALDGKTFRADDPIFSRIYPPNGHGCRCTVGPVAFEPAKVYTEREGQAILEHTDPADYKRMKEGGWLVNRGKTEVVFDLNKAYRKQLKAKDPKAFRFGVEKSYGEKGMDFNSLRDGGLPEREVNLKSNADALAWFDRTSIDTGAKRVLVVSDHLGRKAHIGQDDFAAHLEGKHRTDRHASADLIPTVMGDPDEVWITDSERQVTGLTYVKFYDQGIMRVNAVPDGEGFRITTWTADWADNERRGLLIKRHK